MSLRLLNFSKSSAGATLLRALSAVASRSTKWRTPRLENAIGAFSGDVGTAKNNIQSASERSTKNRGLNSGTGAMHSGEQVHRRKAYGLLRSSGIARSAISRPCFL